jgi:transglutaminase-like putative cysteine protease
MSQRRSVALAAAGGTLLATAPLTAIFADWTWVVHCVLVVSAVSGAAIGARALRAQPWLQLLAMLAALLVMLTWLARGPGAFLGTIPTRSTFQAFGQLLGDASADIRKSGLPVPDDPALLFLVALGVGLVAVLVDLLSVPLRRPAMAGFPMLAIYAVPVFVHTDSVSPIPFMIGAAGFLWLLGADNVDRVRRFGRRFTGEGRGVDLWEPSPLAAAGRRLAFVGVLLAVAAPLAIPGMTTGFLERFNGGNGEGLGPGSGTGGTVNLFATLEGNLHQSKSFEMLKVTTNEPNPYYIRFATADQLTPAGFRTRPLGTNNAVTAGGIPDPAIDNPGASQKLFHATVTAVNFDMRYLPVYRILAKTQKLDGSWLFDDLGDQVYSLRSSTRGRTWSFDYAATEYSPASLRGAQLDPQSSVREFAKVPQQQQYVVDLVRQLTNGKTNDYDRVMAIFTYFTTANNFRYSLSTKPGTSGSDIVNFLQNKQGYCEQYAAAMAWMVRTANIPARVAFGFTRGSKQGQTYALTNLNLHAWTEVYFSGFGWVPFDATPTLSGTVTSLWAPDPNHPNVGPTGTTGPGANNPGVNPSDEPGLAPHKNLDPGGDNSTLTPAGGQKSRWMWWTLGGALILILLLCLPSARRSSLRRQRLRVRAGERPTGRVAVDADTGPPGEMRVVASPALVIREAHAAWDEFLDTLIDYGIPLDSAQTPRETVRRIIETLYLGGPPAEALRLLARAEERARYARTPLDVGNLTGPLREVRAAVASRATRRARLRATLLPPSVIQRWRTRAGTVGANVVGAVGRSWEGAVRVASPRRLLPGRPAR